MYFGNELQVALQQRVEALHDHLYATPGSCNAGRFCGTDDPQVLGWPAIEEALRRDTVFGFRLRPASERKAIGERLAALGFQFHTWNVFFADLSEALPPAQAVLVKPLPADLSEHVLFADDADTRVLEIQTLMAEHGIAPFSARLLRGELGAATTPYLCDRDGRVVACAHAYLPHNRFSAHARSAWVGLVTVAGSQRGRGLGTRINARAIALAAASLGATAIYELVASDNVPSRRMVESCGARLRGDLLCGMASAQAQRFTK